MNTIVEDVLIYLPEWTIKPPHKPHPEYAKAFIDDKEDPQQITSELNVRKHISPDEILRTYHMTRIRVANYLSRERVPCVNACYVATCMWTAGVLEEKYKFKSSQRSQLIIDARDMLQPYIRRFFRVLNSASCKPEVVKPIFHNCITLTVTEE
ncbi:hypothetical protein [Methanosphaera sp.]